MFAQALGKERRETHPKEEAILQYADSMLIWNPTTEASDQKSTEALNFLETWVHKFFQMKAQLSKQQVKYLRYVINPGSRQLPPDRKQPIYLRPEPWAAKRKLSVYPREQQGRLGGKENSPEAHAS